MKKIKNKKAPKKAAKKPLRKPPVEAKGPRRAAKPAGPRSQALPGMAKVRDTVLDDLCESIGERRDRASTDREENNADMQLVLTRMRERKIPSYHHAGVQLVYVEGLAKVQVRKWKGENATANAESAESEVTTEDLQNLADADNDVANAAAEG